MKIDYDVLLMLVMLASYTYTLVHRHIILAKMDKTVKIQRHSSGEINYRNIAAALGEINVNDPEMKKASFLSKVSQVILFIFIGFLVLDLLVKTADWLSIFIFQGRIH
jgi:hypothetical protein